MMDGIADVNSWTLIIVNEYVSSVSMHIIVFVFNATMRLF